MLNVTSEIKGDKLVLTVDLTQRHGASSSGKTTIVASTQGNARIAPSGKFADLQFGLNVYAKGAAPAAPAKA